MNQFCQLFQPRVHVLLHTSPLLPLKTDYAEGEREWQKERQSERQIKRERERERDRHIEKERDRSQKRQRENKTRERERERAGQIERGIVSHVGTVTQKSYPKKIQNFILSSKNSHGEGCISTRKKPLSICLHICFLLTESPDMGIRNKDQEVRHQEQNKK